MYTGVLTNLETFSLFWYKTRHIQTPVDRSVERMKRWNSPGSFDLRGTGFSLTLLGDASIFPTSKLVNNRIK